MREIEETLAAIKGQDLTARRPVPYTPTGWNSIHDRRKMANELSKDIRSKAS